jgi:hypothetical protein
MNNAPKMAAIINAAATMLSDIGSDLEGTAEKVTEFSLSHGIGSSEFIVVLQNFDRLRQELQALSNVLGSCAGRAATYESLPEDDEQLWREIERVIPIAALKLRLGQYVGTQAEGAAPEHLDEVF